jgi:hypothetical protein
MYYDPVSKYEERRKEGRKERRGEGRGGEGREERNELLGKKKIIRKPVYFFQFKGPG